MNDDPYFPKTPRFAPVRRLGEGGFGVVFEAVDREWRERIALKVLRASAAGSFVRFKREFRSLADIRHPNVVRLHQLHSAGEAIYFTMDLVDGLPFGAALRSPSEATDVGTAGTAPSSPKRSFRATPVAPFDAELAPRLARLLLQLGDGLDHLHRAGYVHRDIKPSNVLVSGDDHVVVVDFGLVDDPKREGARDPWTGTVPGTLGYVAPETTTGELGAASDCWSVGVLLAETLCGGGSIADVNRARSEVSDPRLAELYDLAALLLEPDPTMRATLSDVARVARSVAGVVGDTREKTRERAPFVGRKRELEALDASLASLTGGSGSWVRVRGPAGVGKSALLERFVANAVSDGTTWVLANVCRDRELVPFRGVDALMDQLGAALRNAPDVQADVAAVDDVGLVGSTFRALAVEGSAVRAAHDEAIDARRRMFAAWRNVLAAVARKRRLVLVIDDVHWGDADSGLLLSHLIESSAPILVIVSLRPEGGANPLSEQLDRALERHSRSWVDIDLEPMGDDDARELASRLGSANDDDIARAVREAAGIPLFLIALATRVDAKDGGSFDAVIEAQLASLSSAAVAVLEITALSTIPLPEDVLLTAIDDARGSREALIELDVGRLLRRSPRDGSRVVEPFHDHVRQAVLRPMTAPTTRERHRALAHAFSRYHEERPDLLFVHHAGAGEDELASMHGERAAHRAHEALAFDRASSLFLEAAKLTKDVVRRQRLTEHGGDSLIAGGRTKAAAMVFDELAVGAAGDALARVQRKAAEAYLVTGHQPEGLRIWRRAALGMGLGFPKTPLGAAVGAVLALFRARFPSLHRLVKRTTPAEATARAEAALAAAKGLIATDPMHGVLFGAESLAHARVAGTADALVTSLSFVAAACLAAAGGISRQWAVALLEEADGLSGPEHGPHLPAIVTIARAQIALFQGRWAEAAERAQSGLATLAGTGRVRAWEASMARVARVRALEELGEFGRLVRETEEWLARAGETGDVFGVVTSHLTLGIGSLATATPEAAESHANTADGIWRGTGYSVQRFYADRIRVLSTLQRGDLDEAVRRLGTVSRAVRASMIFRIPTGRIDALWMEARVALGCLQGKDGRVGALRALARSLEREDHVPARAHAAFIRARLASSLGEPDEPHLLAARERYAEAGMVPMSLLVEGCRQPSAVAAALDRLAELGVADPVAWCRGHGVDVQAQIPRVSEAAR